MRLTVSPNDVHITCDIVSYAINSTLQRKCFCARKKMGNLIANEFFTINPNQVSISYLSLFPKYSFEFREIDKLGLFQKTKKMKKIIQNLNKVLFCS